MKDDGGMDAAGALSGGTCTRRDEWHGSDADRGGCRSFFFPCDTTPCRRSNKMRVQMKG